jgi:hypothetical protein
MRHFFLASTVALGPRSMVAATVEGILIAPTGITLFGAPGLLGASSVTVDVPAIAAGANQYLRAAADAQKKSPSCITPLGLVTQTWTKRTTGGILPRHTCSARCGARRRYDLLGCDRHRACPQRGQGFSAASLALGVGASRVGRAVRTRSGTAAHLKGWCLAVAGQQIIARSSPCQRTSNCGRGPTAAARGATSPWALWTVTAVTTPA